jgi:anti-sigma factor RsiW
MTDTPPPRDGVPPEDLVAFLDGELPEAEAEAVEVRIGLDPATRREAEALKRTWDLLDYLPRPEPSPSFTSRTLDRLDLPVAGAPSPPATPAPPRPHRPRRPDWLRWSVAAAAVALAFLLGYGAADRAGRQRDLPDVERLPLSEVQLLENLPLYRHADDLEFVDALKQPDLFGEEAPWR